MEPKLAAKTQFKNTTQKQQPTKMDGEFYSNLTLAQWDRIRATQHDINAFDVFMEECKKADERDEEAFKKRDKEMRLAFANETNSHKGSGSPIKNQRELKKAGFELSEEIKEKENKKEAKRNKRKMNKMKNEGKIAPIWHYFPTVETIELAETTKKMKLK